MSHTTALKAVQMLDKEILLHVAEQLKLEYIGDKKHPLFDGTSHEGHGFMLQGWKYPMVVNTETGNAAYDNYNGHWGNQVELDKLCQAYAAESNRRQAALQGYFVQSEYLDPETQDLIQTFETMHTA